MVVVRLWGGLGNQMFQYAYGYSVAKRNNDELLLDTTFFTEEYLTKNPRFTKQKLGVLQFPLEYKETFDSSKFKSIGVLQNKYINKLIRMPGEMVIRLKGDLSYVKEGRAEFIEKFKNIKRKNLYLDGYWQSEKYFKEYIDDIRKQFSTEDEQAEKVASTSGITDTNSVAVHIRLGDYAEGKRNKNGLFKLPFSYYEKAMNEIKKLENDVKFYVFTNDVKKVKEYINGMDNICIANEGRELSDIQEWELMSKCKHQIVSNSTFSWWAAWLNKNENKKIIAPDLVYGNKDIVPESWKRVPIE